MVVSRLLLLLALCTAPSSAFAPTRLSAPRRNVPVATRATPSDQGDRRTLLAQGLVAVALIAPQIGLIVAAPDDSTREATLEEWCKSDYYTLLGGGAGFGGGGGGGDMGFRATARDATADQ